MTHITCMFTTQVRLFSLCKPLDVLFSHLINQTALSLHLEPVYLANVLLFIKDRESITAFPFISRNCREATLNLKVNHAAFFKSSRDTLWFFPNTNTMVVQEAFVFQKE